MMDNTHGIWHHKARSQARPSRQIASNQVNWDKLPAIKHTERLNDHWNSHLPCSAWQQLGVHKIN